MGNDCINAQADSVHPRSPQSDSTHLPCFIPRDFDEHADTGHVGRNVSRALSVFPVPGSAGGMGGIAITRRSGAQCAPNLIGRRC